MYLIVQKCTTSHQRQKKKYAIVTQLESEEWAASIALYAAFHIPVLQGLDFMDNMLDCSKKTALWHRAEGAPETCSFQNLL